MLNTFISEINHTNVLLYTKELIHSISEPEKVLSEQYAEHCHIGNESVNVLYKWMSGYYLMALWTDLQKSIIAPTEAITRNHLSVYWQLDSATKTASYEHRAAQTVSYENRAAQTVPYGYRAAQTASYEYSATQTVPYGYRAAQTVSYEYRAAQTVS